MNLLVLLSHLAVAEKLMSEMANLPEIAADATTLKTAVVNDIAELKAGTLTVANLDTLTAAEKLLGDLGGIVGRIGALTGNTQLQGIGTALGAVFDVPVDDPATAATAAVPASGLIEGTLIR